MKKRILTSLSAVLGVLALVLAGCASHGKTVKNRGPICKYGIPQEILDQRQAREDSIRRAEQQQPIDSIANETDPSTGA